MGVTVEPVPEPGPPGSRIGFEWSGVPWWLLGIGATVLLIAIQIFINPVWREGFDFIREGLTLTVLITLASFVLATVLGMFIALGRLSSRLVVSNLAQYYIELIRAVPVIVTILVVVFVLFRMFTDLTGIDVNKTLRATIALSLIYAAFIAEVFRAGIESIGTGQWEAGRALGLKDRQVLRFIVIPQAIRNVFPALGNDLIALLKDSSLVSIVAVRELTQRARLWTGSSFQFRAGFFLLTAFYIVLVIGLSLLLRRIERRMEVPR